MMMGSSSHRSPDRHPSLRNAMMSGCVGSMENSVVFPYAGTGKTSSSSSSSSTKNPHQPSSTSRFQMFWIRGLLEFKGACVHEGVRTVDEAKVTKKTHDAVSRKRNEMLKLSELLAQDPEQECAGKRLQRSKHGVFSQKNCRSEGGTTSSSLPARDVCNSYNTAGYIACKDYPIVAFEAEMAAQAYDLLSNLRQSSKNSYTSTGRCQNAICLHQKETVAPKIKTADLDFEMDRENSRLTEMQSPRRVAGSRLGLRRIKSFPSNETTFYKHGGGSTPSNQTSPASLSGATHLHNSCKDHPSDFVEFSSFSGCYPCLETTKPTKTTSKCLKRRMSIPASPKDSIFTSSTSTQDEHPPKIFSSQRPQSLQRPLKPFTLSARSNTSQPFGSYLKCLAPPGRSNSRESAFAKAELACFLTEHTLRFKLSPDNAKECLIAESCNPTSSCKSGDGDGYGDPFFRFSSILLKAKEQTRWKKSCQNRRQYARVIGEMHVTRCWGYGADSQGNSLKHIALEFVLLGGGMKRPLLYPHSLSCPNSPDHPPFETMHNSCIKSNFDEKVHGDLQSEMKMEILAMVIQQLACSSIKPDDFNANAASRQDHYHLQKNLACPQMLFKKGQNPESHHDKVLFNGDDLRLQELNFKKVFEDPYSKFRDLLGVKGTQGYANWHDERVTIILPAGEHGSPTSGSEGPQPLIQRWKSGGKCDCGSWDLGCGMTILSDEQPLDQSPQFISEINPTKKHNPDKNGPLIIFKKDGKHNRVAMSLSLLRDDLFSLSFQKSMTPLQAFATAVGILYSKYQKDHKYLNNANTLPPKIPYCTIGTSNSISQGKSNHPTKHHRYKEYAKGCHPEPPVSPADRV